MTDNFRVLLDQGYQARREGRLADARAIFIDAVRKAAEASDRPSLAEALDGLAQAETQIGNCEAARHHFASAALLYRQIGPRGNLANALRQEADLARQTPHPADAEPLYREAERIYRDMGKDGALHLANTLRGLALLQDHTASPEVLESLWREARDLYLSCNAAAAVAECDQKLLSGGPTRILNLEPTDYESAALTVEL